MATEDLLIRPAQDSSQGPVARALPANIEAEAAFLGAVLIDNRVIEELTTALAPGPQPLSSPDTLPSPPTTNVIAPLGASAQMPQHE